MERVETRKARAFEDDGARETVHGWMGRPVELRHDKARDASASDATTGADGRCDRLRKEIKHTIQNKLHRACGPEDLVASAKMLSKLTAEDADYPQAHVLDAISDRAPVLEDEEADAKGNVLHHEALFHSAPVRLSTRNADQLEKGPGPQGGIPAVGLKNADSAADPGEGGRVHETE
eukprot:jgi/Pico_ML_1/54538/g4872.t1